MKSHSPSPINMNCKQEKEAGEKKDGRGCELPSTLQRKQERRKEGIKHDI